MIHFLETVIMHHTNLDNPESIISSTPPSPNGQESDTEFIQNLFHDSNCVARIKQLHSKSHSATCFKYLHQGLGNNSYRFGMPRDLMHASKVDDYGIIHLAPNHT